MHRLLALAALLVALSTIAACGDGGGSTTSTARTIEVDMVDLAFKPDAVKVARGETVQFVFTNRGEVVHDAFIGDAGAQADHEADMRKGDDDGHGGHGDDESAVTVEKGDTGEIVYRFDKAGTVEIGCHQPGHYAAGMKVTVEVA